MKQRSAALALGFLLVAAIPMRAPVVTWNGAGGNTDILNGSNWSSGAPGLVQVDMVFPDVTNRTVNFDQTIIGFLLGTDVTAGNINFSGATPGNYLFTGSGSPTLQLNGDITSTNSPPISVFFDSSLGLRLGSGMHSVSPALTNGIEIQSVVSGTGGISKDDTGGLILGAANTYTGSTAINNGTVTVFSLANGGAASGIGASSNSAGNLLFNGGTLRYSGGNGSTNRLFTLASGGGTIDISNPTVAGSFSFTNTGDIGFIGANTSQTLTVAGNPSYSSTVYFSPRITDNGTGLTSVIAANGSFWRFSAANTYTGGTTIQNGGTFIAINSTGSATGTGLVTIDSGGRLVIGSNSPDGAIASNILVNGILEFNRSTDYTYAGSLSGNGSFNHNGTAGAITLNGASTFSGTTNVNNGKLLVAANSALGTSNVTINGGKLLVGGGVSFGNSIGFGISGGTLGGTGTFTSPLTLGSNVNVSPGMIGPGSLNFASGLTANDGLSAAIEIRAPSGVAGTDWDVIDVTGAFDLTPLTGTGNFTLKVISLTLANTPGAVSGLSGPASWNIAIATTLTGFNAADFTIDSSQFVGGGNFTLSAPGNNLILSFTPVPEPSTYALLLTGLTVGLVYRRQKHLSRRS